ncbi:GlxA family transcriptional regulator [Roseovarius phycicola]|uniref:GlxA family transcriptional regulator n=1 Tax=Roseovarius phycicola TaxID=3080976 RepID=A0ABZ2HHK7_9RHOB
MPEWTKSTSQPTKVSLLLFDQFSNLCLANCIEPLRAANMQGDGQVFDWSILSPDGAACRSSSGLEVLAQAELSSLKATDYLFVMASYGHDRHDAPNTRRLLRAAARKADRIVGLDAGPWLLASAGLLDGRRATVHWDLLDAFTERFLAVEVERARVVKDGQIVTCAGAMSALDLTLDLISDHLGMAARLEIEALFLHGDPPVGQAQPARLSDPLVHRALQLMRDSVEKPMPLTQLARALSCQPRTLDRRFRARLGASPGKVYRHLRLAAARKLIEDSPLGMAEIAVRCGYDSPAALTRAIGQRYGVTPRMLRRG